MPEPRELFSGRLVALVCAVGGTVVLIGIVTGTSPSTYLAKRPAVRERPDAGEVPPARTHAELERRPWGGGPASSGWLESVRVAEAMSNPDRDDTESVAAAVRDRAARRAFDGAPPVVPHPVRAGGAAECLACHAEGFALGGRRASPVPHTSFASCTQCHVSSAASFTVVAANPAARAESGWTGLASPDHGEQAYPGAPPAVPHPTRMRERCESCHGAQGRAALRTPHPERQSCLQCHPASGGRGGERSR